MKRKCNVSADSDNIVFPFSFSGINLLKPPDK
jgi:hypothetical protein